MSSILSPVGNNRLFSISSPVINPLLLLKIDLQIYIKSTIAFIVNPRHQKEKELGKRANCAIIQTRKQMIIYYIILLGKIFSSKNIIL